MSGWRAAVVALSVGGVILAVGWVVSRPSVDPGNPTVTNPIEAANVVLVCPQALALACDELAARLGAGRAKWRPGEAPLEDQVVMAAARDLPVPGAAFAQSPIAIAVWHERSGILEAACGGSINVSCLIESAGMPWEEIGGQSGWGEVKLGLADPISGIADQEAWRLFSGQALSDSFSGTVRARQQDDGDLMAELVQFGPSRADAVVTSEVAIASQLENAKNRGVGRLDVFYPDPTPTIEYALQAGDGRAARRLAEQLAGEDIQALLGSLGLRPATGEAQNLMPDLGTSGGPLPSLSATEIDAVIASWQEVMG
jgi:hypothetical protein